jgi:hypothetical protein
MARNKAQEFATMDEDERKDLAGDAAGQSAGNELAFDDPRDADKMGRQYASMRDEVADPDERDGDAANLDDAAHRRAVAREARRTRTDDTENDA